MSSRSPRPQFSLIWSMLSTPHPQKALTSKTFKRRQAQFVRFRFQALSASLIASVPCRLPVNPEFVALLFTYRQVFHAIAARSIRSGSVCPAVVCWVDVVFAKIAVAITVISPGVPSSASQSEQVHGGMQKQLDCHLLRAATQLPSAPISR